MTPSVTTDLFGIFAEDHSLITYRPRWNTVTGSVTATILLQQILFYWNQHGRTPFYKFKEPCSHDLYRDGDSWTETLGFTRREFDTAIRKIGYKTSKTRHETHDKPVEYWTTVDRITYYTIHEANLHHMIEQLYAVDASPDDAPSDDTPPGDTSPDSTSPDSTSPETPCQHGECPLKYKSAFTKTTNPPLDVKAESAFRKTTNPPLDLDKDQRDHTENTREGETEKKSLPPSLSFFIQYFHLDRKDVTEKFSADQQKMFEQFEDSKAWEEVCQIWKANCHNVWNITGMFDRYRKILLRDEDQPTLPLLDVPGNGNGNSHEQQHLFPQAKAWLDSLGQEDFDRIHTILQQKYTATYKGCYACWKQPDIRQELVHIWTDTRKTHTGT